jgi:hypothetical protein
MASMDIPHLLLKAMDIHIHTGYLSRPVLSAQSEQVDIPQTKAHQGKPKQEYLEKIEDQNSIGTSVILGISGDRLKIPVVNHHNV